MTDASPQAWFNGEIVAREDAAPSIASSSFHLGTSVFDGMMAYWNIDCYYVHRCAEHLVRFSTGSKRLGLDFDWSVDQLTRGINDLLALQPPGTQYVRPIAYRRGPELWITGAEGRAVDVSIFTVRTEAHRNLDAPITCHISPVERISSRSIPGQTKVSGSYVNSFTARRTAEAAGFNDAIMLDRAGRVAEASAANVFFIQGDQLVTPPLNPDVFPGITRRTILDLAREEGIDAREADVSFGDVSQYDGAFLCSTLMEVRALSRLGDRELKTQGLPVYDTILRAFRRTTSRSDHGNGVQRI